MAVDFISVVNSVLTPFKSMFVLKIKDRECFSFSPCHTIRKENYVGPLRLKRTELFGERIMTANMDSLEVTRGRLEKEMNLAETRSTSRGSQIAPYNKDLQDALNEYVQRHPESKEIISRSALGRTTTE